MSRGLSHHFATMAYNNAWSNHRLLAAIGTLPQAEFTATRVSFFPSLKATLNHIVTVDWYYVDALERALAHREPNHEAWRFYDPEEPFDNCAALAVAQREVDRRLVVACPALTDDRHDLPVPVVRRVGVQMESATHCRASVPAPDPPSRAGARDARGYERQTAAARRVLLCERGASARRGTGRAWLHRGDDLERRRSSARLMRLWRFQGSDHDAACQGNLRGHARAAG